ncbi:MAG TPA: HEAT repeat domain-containing protein [Anaerolineales bacterium]
MKRLASILRVKPGEGRLVLLVGLLFLCIQAGQGLGDNAASALFFLRFGVGFLPYMYLLLGGTTVVLTTAYSAGLGRFNRGRFFQALILGTVLVLLVERFVLLRPFPLLYPVLWLTISGLGMILGTFVWNVAGEVSDARQAKRLFPLYTSAGILGSVVGNSVTGLVAKRLGTDNLLLFFAALLAAAYFLTRSVAGSYFQPAKVANKGSGFWSDLRAGYDFVRGSELMKLIAYASVLFSILFFSIAFPFNKVVTASFPDEAGVAGYLGLFSGITTAITFLVSLLIANRVYSRLGIVNSVLLLPLTYLFGFIVFASRYSLAGAVAARFAQLVVLSGVAGTAWSALFNVVPSQKRGQVLAFENGLPSQIGVALSGLLLILGERVLTTTQIFLMGILVTLACGYLVWRMRAAYGEALVDALRAGRLEVFTGEGAGFGGLQNDAAALQVVTQALQDAKPTTRQLAAQILERLANPSARGPLLAAAADPDPGVRAAALSALAAPATLGSLSIEPGVEPILAALDDSDANVRLQAAKTLCRLDLPTDDAAKLKRRAEKLLEDGALPVRMQAILLLARLGAVQPARLHLRAALEERDAQVQVAALETFGQAVRYFDGAGDSAPALRLLADPLSRVRAAACAALATLNDAASAQALVTSLHDADRDVRLAAAESLRRRGPEAAVIVLEVLDSESEAVRDAGLDALAPGAVNNSERLRRFAHEELERVRAVRTQEASLPSSGRAVAFLRESLQRQVRLGEDRLVKIVGLIGNARAMHLVQKSLSGSDAEARAAAMEALETLGDKTLARDIITLLEEDPRRSSPEAVLSDILLSQDHGNRWTCALAIQAIQELGLKDFAAQLEELRQNPDPLIAEVAADALGHFEKGEPMNTLQTVSTLQRVLLLREIPIFSDLSPEDLQRIATAANEQWFPRDTTIFRQDEIGDRMFVIVEGHVHVVRSANGKEQVLAQRGPGDFVGEMAIIESAPRLASLVTRREVRVLAIDGETFKGILRERPEVSLAVLRSMSRRLRETAG